MTQDEIRQCLAYHRITCGKCGKRVRVVRCHHVAGGFDLTVACCTPGRVYYLHATTIDLEDGRPMLAWPPPKPEMPRCDRHGRCDEGRGVIHLDTKER